MALLRIGGAGPGKLFLMIISEGMWIALLGLVLGLVAGHLGMNLAGALLEKGYKYQFSGLLWVTEEMWIIGGALFVGLLAAVLPAVQGSRTNLHRTLAES